MISTLVAGMLPLIGSKSRTVAVASTLSITSPSMRAGDPGRSGGASRSERGPGKRAVRWTATSMESLTGGCSEATAVAKVGDHMPGRINANSALLQAKNELFCQRSFEK